MSTARAKRIEKLVVVRQKSADAAKGKLAQASGATRSAISAQEEARAALVFALDEAADARYSTVADLLEIQVVLDSMRARLEHATRAVHAAEIAESAARVECIAADRELKKVEALRDALLEQGRAAEAVKERKLEDEIATRIVARREVAIAEASRLSSSPPARIA